MGRCLRFGLRARLPQRFTLQTISLSTDLFKVAHMPQIGFQGYFLPRPHLLTLTVPGNALNRPALSQISPLQSKQGHRICCCFAVSSLTKFSIKSFMSFFVQSSSFRTFSFTSSAALSCFFKLRALFLHPIKLSLNMNKLMFLHVQNLCFPIPLNTVTASFTDSNGAAVSISGLFVITVSSA